MRPGLIRKKINRRDGTRGTYWVRPKEFHHTPDPQQISLTNPTNPTKSAPITPAQAYLARPPYQRRGLLPLRAPAMPILTLPRVGVDTSALGPERVATNASAKAFMAANAEGLQRVAGEIGAAFTNAGGYKRLDVVGDRMVDLMMGQATMAAYTPTTGDVMLRGTVAKGMAQAMATGQNRGDANDTAAMYWTHEVLHSASNKDRPVGEPLASALQPNRWLEEATTELLAHHYNPRVLEAFTGHQGKDGQPIMGKVTEGQLDLGLSAGVAYRHQSQRFVNLAAYLAGAGPDDDMGKINYAVLGYAAAVKQRGMDRYEYLAGGVLAAHGLDPQAKGGVPRQAMTQTLRDYLGQATPSQLYGNGPDAIEALIRKQLIASYPEGQEPPLIAPPIPKKGGRPSTLKIKI